MRRLPVLFVPLVVVACGSQEPTPLPASASVPRRSTEVPWAAHPRVRAVFDPRVQEVLLRGRLQVTLFESRPPWLPAPAAGPTVEVTAWGQRSRYAVVQSAVIEDAKVRRRLLGDLYQGLVEPGPAASCYDPHHILIAVLDETRVEVVLCFQCKRLELFVDGALVHHVAGFWAPESMVEPLVGSTRREAAAAGPEEPVPATR